MRIRSAARVLAIPVVLGLTACGATSTVSGHPTDGSTPVQSSPASSASSTGTSSTGSATTGSATTGSATPNGGAAGDLVSTLTAGIKATRSAHLTLSIKLAGQQIVAAGDEKLSNGALLAFDFSEKIPGAGDLRFIIVGSKGYVKLPPKLNPGRKPWRIVSATSSDSVVRSLAASLESAKSSASLTNVSDFVNAASSIRTTGSGSATKSYRLDVDVTKLPASFQGKKALVTAGVTSLPVTLSVDPQGRPVLLSEVFAVQGKKVTTRIQLSRYNAAVSISAPPRNQISK